MLGQAQSPLVSGARASRIGSIWWLTSLVAGLVFGSALIMLAADLLGQLAGVVDLPRRYRLGILLAAILVVLAFDVIAVLRGRATRLGFSRQTPRRLSTQLRRADVVAFLWGVDIGSGVSTFRMTSAIWLGLLAVTLGLVPVYVGVLYGVSMGTTVAALVLRKGDKTVPGSLPRLLSTVGRLRVGYLAATIALGLSVVVAFTGS